MDTRGFGYKVDKTLSRQMSSLPFIINTDISGSTSILPSLRAAMMTHNLNLVDPGDVLKMRQRQKQVNEDKIIINEKNTEKFINKELKDMISEYQTNNTSVLYVGVLEVYRKEEKPIFTAIGHDSLSKETTMMKKERSVLGSRSNEEEGKNTSKLTKNDPVVLYDSNGNVKMPVWAHSFMTPQWFQVWILIIIMAGLIVWGLITSMKIPVPTNIPEPTEQV